jgi:thiamine-monophosphate kinase
VKIRDLGEFGLIARIKDRLPTLPPSVIKGIGDDAAVSSLPAGKQVVTTVDLLIEGVHFDFSFRSLSPYLLGRKSLSVNASDIAAMGAAPKSAFLSLAIPETMSIESLDEFYRGFLETASANGISLLGGDTSASPGPLFISVTLLGEGKKGEMVFRHGARPGDDLYVTGTLGDSLLGLEIAREKGKKPISPAEEYLLNRHFNPTPRVKEGRILGERRLVRAMIDVSDGLLSDLGHICEESRVGARVWVERLPLSPALRAAAAGRRCVDWQLALRGGEDYELLFCAPPENQSRIQALGRKWNCGIARIGRILPLKSGVVIEGGNGPVDPRLFKGYDHFGGPRGKKGFGDKERKLRRGGAWK